MTKGSNLTIVKVTGIDIGNEGCKTDKGVFYPSKVYTGDASISFDALAIKVKRNDKVYIVGDYNEGVTFENVDKIDKDIYEVSLLTSIALSYPSDLTIKTIVSIGLPYDFYQNQEIREKYLKKTRELGTQIIEIYVDENTTITKCIEVVDAEICCQGAIRESFIPSDKIPAIAIDFGGKTLDTLKYKYSSVSLLNQASDDKQNTVEIIAEGDSRPDLGFNEVLDKIIKDLETKGITYKSRQELISVINQDEIRVFGKSPINLKSIRERIIGVYTERVMSYLSNSNIAAYPNAYFLGGCAKLVEEIMVKRNLIEEGSVTVIPNARFANAINYANQAKKNLDRTKYVLEEEYLKQRNLQI